MHEVKLQLKLELCFYCHIFKCSQLRKFSSNGANDTQIGKPDSMTFMIFLPMQKVRGTIYGIPNPNLIVFRETNEIVIYNQSEMQF